MMTNAKYQRWSRVGGILVANAGAYCIVKADMKKDMKGIPRKLNWSDAYYASLLHIFATIVGGVTGPILPIIPVLAIPGVLYKLTDTTPEPNNQHQENQMK